jgi:hypothetical protein
MFYTGEGKQLISPNCTGMDSGNVEIQMKNLKETQKSDAKGKVVQSMRL